MAKKTNDKEKKKVKIKKNAEAPKKKVEETFELVNEEVDDSSLPLAGELLTEVKVDKKDDETVFTFITENGDGEQKAIDVSVNTEEFEEAIEKSLAENRQLYKENIEVTVNDTKPVEKPKRITEDFINSEDSNYDVLPLKPMKRDPKNIFFKIKDKMKIIFD